MPAPPFLDKGKGKEKAAAKTDEFEKPEVLFNSKPSPKFQRLVDIFESLEMVKNNSRKVAIDRRDLIAKCIKRWREHAGLDLYPMIRLLLPARDTSRKTFGLKEAKLAEGYVQALDIDKNSTDGQRLINWKAPALGNPGAGEFSNVAFTILKERSSLQEGRLTVDEVNIRLDQLSRVFIEARKQNIAVGVLTAKLLKGIERDMTALEQKWLIRIILKDLKISVGDNTVLAEIHPQAGAHFLVCSDIRQVCWKLWDVNYSLPADDMKIKLFKPFKPMLSLRQRNNLKDIVVEMKKFRFPDSDYSSTLAQKKEEFYFGQDEFFMEEKIDGERMQLHAKFLPGNKCKFAYFSRKGQDYTNLYGENETVGSLTPVIQDSFHSEIAEIIIDGEMLLWNPADEVYVPFGTLKTGAKLPALDLVNDYVTPRPIFKAFDLLYLKGKNGADKCYLDVALKDRIKGLRMCFTPLKGRLEFCTSSKGKTISDLRNALEVIVSTRAEGLVIKNPDSKYMLNGRVPAWIKLKPEYMDELTDTMDCVAIGAYWGQGGRKGFFSSYLFGLRTEDIDPKTGESVFKTFCKVGSGFNMDTYEKLQEVSKGKWFEVAKGKKLPGWFDSHGTVPDVYIKPSQSFIIKIKATEIVEGLDYGAQQTLRFPRAISYRHELNAETDGMRFSELVQFRKGIGKRIMTGDLTATGNKKAKLGRSSAKAKMISTGLDDIKVVDSLFGNYTFFVSLGILEKRQIEKEIIAHGGKIIQTVPDADVERLIIAAAETLPNLLRIRGAEDLNILSSNWIFDSITADDLIPFSAYYTLAGTDAVRRSDDWDIPATSAAIKAATMRRLEAEATKGLYRVTVPPPSEAAIENAAEAEDGGDTTGDEEGDFGDDDDEAPTQSASAGGVITADAIEVEEEEEEEEEEVVVEEKKMEEVSISSDEDEVMITQSARENSAMLAPGHLSEPEVDTDDEDVEPSNSRIEKSITPEALPFIQTATQTQTLYDRSQTQVQIEEEEEEEEFTFAPYCFYLDTEDNASSNGFKPSDQNFHLTSSATKDFEITAARLKKCGGILTSNILDSQLTHIIVSAQVSLRYPELMKRASNPSSPKRILYLEWVKESASDLELASEEKHKPSPAALRMRY